MIGEAVTPIDEATGIPLPLMPVDDLPPVPGVNTINRTREADWHHPFHPRDDLVHGGIGLVAIRNCRSQWTKYEHHHNRAPGYHAIYQGPPIPEDEYAQFRTVILAAAGYIPPHAIAYTSSAPERIVPLSDEQRTFLWRSGQIRIDRQIPVRDFLIHYLIKGGFIDEADSRVEEFLKTENPVHRLNLGNAFLRAAAYEAVTPVNPLYRKAKKQELLPAGAAHSAGRFVMHAMTANKGRWRAFQELTKYLDQAA